MRPKPLESFPTAAARALEAIDRQLGGLEHEDLDVQLGGDVLTLAFGDGVRFVINSHSAASQIWMAAGSTAWHFDLVADGRWVAAKSGDELFSALARVVSAKLGETVVLQAPPSSATSQREHDEHDPAAAEATR